MTFLWRYREAVVWCLYVAYTTGVHQYFEAVR